MNRKLTLGLAAAAVAGAPLGIAGVSYATEAPPAVPATNGAVAAEPFEPSYGVTPDAQALYAAYWDAGYDAAQLQALAEEWTLDEFEAKARAGQLILDGDTTEIDEIVEGIENSGSATQGMVEAFFTAGYTYDDAVELAGDWNVGPYEAKIQAGELIVEGRADEVDALLAE